MKNRNCQRGQGEVIFVLFLLFFALVLKGAFNVLPIYIENRTVKTVVGDFIVDQGAEPIARQELMDALDKRFVINGVGTVSSDNFKVVSKNGQRFLVGNYVSSVPYMANINLVVSFDNIRFDITDITVQ